MITQNFHRILPRIQCMCYPQYSLAQPTTTSNVSDWRKVNCINSTVAKNSKSPITHQSSFCGYAAHISSQNSICNSIHDQLRILRTPHLGYHPHFTLDITQKASAYYPTCSCLTRTTWQSVAWWQSGCSWYFSCWWRGVGATSWLTWPAASTSLPSPSCHSASHRWVNSLNPLFESL